MNNSIGPSGEIQSGNSIGSVPSASIGQETVFPTVAPPTPTYNDDPNVTHARGRVDDIVRNLALIRARITPESFGEVAGLLDDADKAVESALDILLRAEL